MPITTTFDSKNHIGTTESILFEWTRDYLSAASYIVQLFPPASPTTPTVWFQLISSRNREPRTRNEGRTVQRKDLNYAVSMLSNVRQTSLDMAEIFGNAVLASASALGSAGLRQVSVSEFMDLTPETQTKTFRRTGALSFTITLTV